MLKDLEDLSFFDCEKDLTFSKFAAKAICTTQGLVCADLFRSAAWRCEDPLVFDLLIGGSASAGSCHRESTRKRAFSMSELLYTFSGVLLRFSIRAFGCDLSNQSHFMDAKQPNADDLIW
jgi:hypothetical protein